jgi:hypothetical protein
MKVPKGVRNAVLSVVALIVLFLGGGMALALMSGGEEPEPAATKPVDTEPKYQPLKKPAAPPPNAAVGVALGSITSPVAAGSNAALSVRTTPTANCTVVVTYNGINSRDSGLAPKVADAYGIATWTWTVEAAVPPGTWPAKITCNYNGRSAVFDTKLQVTKPTQ